MNNRIIILSIIAISLASLLILKENNEESNSNKTHSTHISEIKKDVVVPKKVLYFDNENLENKNEVIDNKSKTYIVKEAEPKNIKEEDIDNYIKVRSLKNITSTQDELNNPDYIIPRFSIYTNIDKKEALKKKDKSIPPATPVIISGSFYSGVPYTVIIDGDIKNEATDIVISNNHPDGSIEEIVNIKNKPSFDNELLIISPPTIGKN